MTKPTVQADTDAIVRVAATTICGTDLHIMKGDGPAVTDGRILGHEAVGTVESVGTGVKNVKPGDRVLVSCITVCSSCEYCRKGRYGQCLWIKDVTITTGLVDANSTPTLLRLATSQQIPAERFVTHHFDLDEMIEAYDVFGRAAETGALKVVLSRTS